MKKNSLKCDQCNYIAKSKNILEKHQWVAMGHTKSKEGQKDKSFQCEQCELNFDSISSKYMHIKEKHKEYSRRIKCSSCDFRTMDEDILRKHMKVAMGHKIPKECNFFMNGFCRRGSFCKFQHPDKVPYNGNTNYGNRNETNNRKSARQCQFRENYFQFPKCNFSHYEICKYQQSCYKGGNCNFVHLSNSSFLDFWPQVGNQQ